ncbi:MAG TPA: hypothetical protein VF173_08720 [Thermoanaerobaculia bacterium]|nr:hypothetical protein [Thermoanaerobaculia bacterium]
MVGKALLALALATATAHAEPVLTLATRSFTDSNGNGLLDCYESVLLQLVVFDNAARPGDTTTGRITIPSDLPINWRFQAPVQQDHGFSGNCVLGPISLGSSPNDSKAVFDYTCSIPADNPNSRGFVLTVLVPGLYVGPSGPFTVKATDEILSPTPATLSTTFTESRVNGCAAADLTLTKSDGGVSVHPGDTVAYSLTYANAGNAAAAAALTETVPANTTFAAAQSSPGWSCAGTAPGSVCTLSLGSLPVAGSGSRIFAVTLSPLTPPSVAQISNSAAIATTDGTPDADPSNNSASDSTPILAGSPDLSLTKSLTSSGGIPGTVAVFTLTVTDRGTGVAQGVSLRETVPANATFTAAQSSPDWTCSGTAAGSTCTASLGTLAAGGSASRLFAVSVAKPFPAGASAVSNTACAATTTPGDPTANNCATATAPITAAADLRVRKTLTSGTGTPGDTLVFNLAVSNGGDQDSPATSLTETVPANTTFNAAASSPGWSCSGTAAGSACTLSLPAIPGAGGSLSRSFAVTIDDPLPAGVTTITNSACDSGRCDTIVIPTDGEARLSVTKSVLSGSAVPGAGLVFAVTVANLGNQAASVTLTETVPAHTTYDAAASSPWTCSGVAAGSSCTVSAGTLAGGGSSTVFRFAVRIDSPLPAGVTQIANSACASIPAGSPVCDQVQVPSGGSPRLVISKSRTSAPPAPGGLVTYAVTVANTGDQDAAAVTLTERVPDGTAFVAGSSDPAWSCSGTACTLTLPALAAGASAIRVFAVRVVSPLPGGLSQIANTACASDVPARNVCATVTDPAGGSPHLTLVKTYAGPPLAAGAALAFHLMVTNSGDQDAASIALTETVPANSTFEAAASDPGWSCVSPAAGGTCGLTIPSLAAGENATVVFTVRAVSPLPPNVRQIANSACAIVAGMSSCDQTSTPMPVSLTATLDDTLTGDANGNSNLDNGDEITYTLVVHNPSAAAALGLRISTQLDSRLGLVTGSVATDRGTVTAGNGAGDATMAVEVPSLGAGETVTIVYRALAVDLAGPGDPGFVATQSTVTGVNFDSVPSDDPATPEVTGDPTKTPLHGTVTPAVPAVSKAGLATLAVLLGLCALPVLKRRGRTAA